MRRYALPGDLTKRVITPALVVYLDRVRENLRRMIDVMEGDVDRWRPHVKTAKIPAVRGGCRPVRLLDFSRSTTAPERGS